MASRPKNKCGKCDYEWFPRGRDASRRCPACGVVFNEVTVFTEKTESEGGKLLKAFAGCIILPIVLCGGCGLLFDRPAPVPQLAQQPDNGAAKSTDPVPVKKDDPPLAKQPVTAKVGPTPENLKGPDELYIPGDELVVAHPSGVAICWDGKSSWKSGKGTGNAQRGTGTGLLKLTTGDRVSVIDAGMTHIVARVLAGELKGKVVYVDSYDTRIPWAKAFNKDDPPVRKRPEEWRSRLAARDFLKEKLNELDSFRGTPHFREYGFAIGGRHNVWLRAVESKMHDETPAEAGGLTSTERMAAHRLWQLGMEYLKLRNSTITENEFSRYARKEVETTIAQDTVALEAPLTELVALAVAPEPRLIDQLKPSGAAVEPSEWKRLGAIETRVVGVKLAPAPMRDRSGREFLTPDPVLRVWVECRAVLPPKNELRRWVSALEPVRLSGPPGTPIERMRPIPGADVDGELRGGHRLVPGGDPVRDVVIFNPPGPKAQDLVLTIDGAHLGESGTMMHTIRAEWWQR
jgi:hypothetical protein